MKSKWMKATSAMLALAVFAAVPVGSAQAINYRSAWMTSWSGCECGNASLSYTDNQINYFNSRMNAHGHNHLSTYTNSLVWGSDIGEDRDKGGQDNYYSDDATAWAYSGHGGAFDDGAGKQNFVVSFCKKGASSFTGTCTVWSRSHVRLGEQSGTYYASPNAGSNRWMVLATCYSVHSAPHQQWAPSMGYGTEYIMGYRGTSADSSTTDEVLGDWVDNAYASTVYTFKSSWFVAIEDWWVDDTGSVVSGGSDLAWSDWRRDNYSRITARRGATEYWSWYSWAWHSG